MSVEWRNRLYNTADALEMHLTSPMASDDEQAAFKVKMILSGLDSIEAVAMELPADDPCRRDAIESANIGRRVLWKVANHLEQTEGVSFSESCRKVQSAVADAVLPGLQRLAVRIPEPEVETSQPDSTAGAMDCLSRQQRSLVQFLNGRKHWTLADTIKSESGAFQKGLDTTDRAVASAIERIKSAWANAGITWDIESRDNVEAPQYRLRADD